MEKSENLNFLKKIKIAIFNLEKYGQLITEKLNKTIKYIIILAIFCSIFISVLDTWNIVKMIDKGMNYIINEVPNFEVKDGQISFDKQFYGYDEEYNVKVLSINKNNLTDDELEKYGKDEKVLILLKDKIIFNMYGNYTEYSYNNIKQLLNINQINKQGIIELYNENGGNFGIAVSIFTTMLLIYFIANVYEILFYGFIVAVFGYLVAQIGKIKIRFSTSFTLAIYSLTLSIILNLIYIIQYNFTRFEIPYFDILYLGIAYIYIVAAILIIKTDLIKQVMELQKIQLEQNKTLNEIEKKSDEEDKKEEDKNSKENKEEKNNNENEENNEPINEEPDGSEI